MEKEVEKVEIKIDINPLFFIINSNTGKIFIINKERKLEIIESTIYSQNKDGEYELLKYGSIQLPYMKLKKKIKINKEKEKENSLYYYIFKEKYCISIFENKINFNSSEIIVSSKDVNKNIKEEENKCLYNDDNDYNLYFSNYMKNLKPKEIKKEKKKKKKEEEIIKFITCRHLDNSFKIYFINKSNIKKDYKPLSFICEDFVSSCCTIFLIINLLWVLEMENYYNFQ